MDSELANSNSYFSVSSAGSRWEWTTRTTPLIQFTSAFPKVRWKLQNRETQEAPAFPRFEIAALSKAPADQPGVGLQLISARSETEPQVVASIFLLDNPLLLCWKLNIINTLDTPIYLDQANVISPSMPRNGKGGLPNLAFPDSHELPFNGTFGDTKEMAVYLNGWQSWSPSGWVKATETQPRTKLGPLTMPMQWNPSEPVPRGRGRFSSDMFGAIVDRQTLDGILIGFLSQQQTFGNLRIRIDRTQPYLQLIAHLDGIRIDPGGFFQTDWAVLQPLSMLESDPWQPYLDLVAKVNNARAHRAPISGWCSWYYFYQDIDHDAINENLDWLSAHCEEISLDVVQIDDGWQAEVGDWEVDESSFPQGMDRMAEEIRDHGFRPGIWLAPLIAKPQARVASQRPEWILRTRFGIPTNPGFVWQTYGRALDASHPEVVDHLRKITTRIVKEWGFDYMKLDFLYAGALNGRRFNTGVTRAQALHNALRAIREAAGEDTYLVGCGCPLGSGIGIFDAMRIGPDVAPSWWPRYSIFSRFLHQETGIPSACNSTQQAVERLALHQRWWVNDPDCVLLRDEKSQLDPGQVQLLATITSMTGGVLMNSDHLPALRQERVEWFARLLPPLNGKCMVIPGSSTEYAQLCMPQNGPAGSWWLLALCNWSAEDREVVIDLNQFDTGGSQILHVFDFWNERYNSIHTETTWREIIPAQAGRLFSIRWKEDHAMWVGDTLHISQGGAVRAWSAADDHFEAKIDLARRVKGSVYLHVPNQPRLGLLNSKELELRLVQADVYVADVEIWKEGVFRVEWDQVR